MIIRSPGSINTLIHWLDTGRLTLAVQTLAASVFVNVNKFQYAWVRDFVSTTAAAFNELVASLYSIKGYQAKSSGELQELISKLMGMHPVQDFKEIIALHDSLDSILEKQRQEFSRLYNNSSPDFIQKQQRVDMGIVSLFNGYLERVYLANYMYPFLDHLNRYAFESEFLATEHLLTTTFVRKNPNFAPASMSNHELIVEVLNNYLLRGESMNLHNRIFSLFLQRIAQEVRKRNLLDFSHIPVSELSKIQEYFKDPIKLTEEAVARIRDVILPMVEYAHNFGKVSFKSFLALQLESGGDHGQWKPLMQILGNNMGDKFRSIVQDFTVFPQRLSKLTDRTKPLITLNREKYRESFKTKLFEWIDYGKLVRAEHLPPIPPFMTTPADVYVFLELPYTIHDNLTHPFQDLFTLRNRYDLTGRKLIASLEVIDLELTRSDYYRLVSEIMNKTIVPKVRPNLFAGERDEKDWLKGYEKKQAKKITTRRKKSSRSAHSSSYSSSYSGSTSSYLEGSEEFFEESVDGLSSSLEEPGMFPQATESREMEEDVPILLHSPPDSIGPRIPKPAKKKESQKSVTSSSRSNTPFIHLKRPQTTCDLIQSYKSSQVFKSGSFSLATEDLGTLCGIFRYTKGQVKWRHFTNVLSALGFKMSKDRAGSRIGFLHPAVSYPLIVHQPHPSNDMSRLMLKVSIRTFERMGIDPNWFVVF